VGDSECLAQIGQAVEEKEMTGESKYKEMFRLKALHLLAFFILVYVGVEVTIGGRSLAPRCLQSDTVRTQVGL
jgi:fucose permease